MHFLARRVLRSASCAVSATASRKANLPRNASSMGPRFRRAAGTLGATSARGDRHHRAGMAAACLGVTTIRPRAAHPRRDRCLCILSLWLERRSYAKREAGSVRTRMRAQPGAAYLVSRRFHATTYCMYRMMRKNLTRVTTIFYKGSFSTAAFGTGPVPAGRRRI